ncbi:hypothetical protein EYZ11_002334 [Aspergillus tanneri]|uniref:Conserved oligomeric Golgi complex subunit 1 n=1 Tax=Aspergillus tanneri TaxID=1220188 RepID=A0A4S3JT10_9EURO|nr:hypothetical protein EYZ11_002334 [Aspergillus tanneri]
MASEGPDPQNLRSWQDAFQYPIPTVRRVEQELRRDIASNKEKLRALVGTRYRELVGTAETIVSMNQEIHDVDSTLADIGQRCNPRLIEKKCGQTSAGSSTCSTPTLCDVDFTTVKTTWLVVARGKAHVPPFLENLRTQIASLRGTLLRRIEKRLALAISTADDIIEALAAYCLSTSSSSDAAIRHFHQVRLDYIGNQSASDDTSGKQILNALRLYIRTLQSSKVLFSRRLSDVLGKLKARPILTDPDIRGLDDLGLDVLGRWVATDVSNFTPWIKLSEFTKPEAEKLIKQWSKHAFGKFVDECQKSLTSWQDFSSLLVLREKTLEMWLCSWSSTLTHSSLQVLEGLRTLFTEQLKQILSDQARSLDVFSLDIATLLSSWDDREHVMPRSLWDHELMSLDYSHGASIFKATIADRLLGRDEEVSGVLEKYQGWLSLVERSRQSVDELRRVHWTDVLEGEDADSEIDTAATLNEDDTQILWEALQSAVRAAFDTLDSSFNSIFKGFGASSQSGKAAFLLKLIRLVRRDLPTEFVDSGFALAKDIVPQLQEMLATEVVMHTQPLRLITGSSPKIPRVPGRTLWEGDPECPVQPSPSTFKYLHRLVESMDRQGPGIWDVSTINVLKHNAQKKLSGSIASALEALNSSRITDGATASAPPEGEKPDGSKSDSKEPGSTGEVEEHNIHDWKLQLYFDMGYLGNALAVKGLEHGEFTDICCKLREELASDANLVKSIDQGAVEYWKRTQLLLGLLAVGAEQ